MVMTRRNEEPENDRFNKDDIMRNNSLIVNNLRKGGFRERQPNIIGGKTHTSEIDKFQFLERIFNVDRVVRKKWIYILM